MTNDWWPAPLAHIATETPWAEDNIVVAEVRSFDEEPHAGQRTVYTALVPADQLDAVGAALEKLDCAVSTSGPHPSFMKDRPYTPKFWIGANGLPTKQYEPLVLAWSSHNKSVLQLDPAFTMTYGLAPRAINDGAVYWDDPSAPRHGVAVVAAPSEWKYPLGSHSYVTVSKDYLQDYLSLRHMALVQVFWEIRWARSDTEIEGRLGDHEAVDLIFSDRRIHIGRALGQRNVVCAQVWGARILARPGSLPISSDTLDDEGLAWPGIEGEITNDIAQGLRPGDYVYVDDVVLASYEGRTEFSISPLSGAVSFGSQWGVDFCTRVGRSLIRLELKKLYEGAPPDIVHHWHRHAVPPLPAGAYPAALHEPNVGTRAKKVTYGVVGLGESLCRLAQSIGLSFQPEDFVGLRRRALDYSGWWTFDVTEPITRHVPLSMKVDDFLDRCMSLGKVIMEGMGEKALRAMLLKMEVPTDRTKDLGSLKLLDLVVRLAQVSQKSGLSLSSSGSLLWQRLQEQGGNTQQPIAYLFALYDVRILKAHIASARGRELREKLKRFGVQPGQELGGYGLILDRIYDALGSGLEETAATIEGAL